MTGSACIRPRGGGPQSAWAKHRIPCLVTVNCVVDVMSSVMSGFMVGFMSDIMSDVMSDIMSVVMSDMRCLYFFTAGSSAMHLESKFGKMGLG